MRNHTRLILMTGSIFAVGCSGGEKSLPTESESPGGVLKAGLHQSGRPADPDAAAVPDRELAARTAAWIERRFPEAGPLAQTETCLYTIRENDEFLLERRGRIVIGSACSGHGFKFAPSVGRRLAALATDVLAATGPL